MNTNPKDHASSMNVAKATEASEAGCIKTAGNKLIIELRVYDQNPIEFFLQLHYQIIHLLNNQDEDNRIKCLSIHKFLEQTTPVSLEELTAISEQARRYGLQALP